MPSLYSSLNTNAVLLVATHQYLTNWPNRMQWLLCRFKKKSIFWLIASDFVVAQNRLHLITWESHHVYGWWVLLVISLPLSIHAGGLTCMACYLTKVDCSSCSLDAWQESHRFGPSQDWCDLWFCRHEWPRLSWRLLGYWINHWDLLFPWIWSVFMLIWGVSKSAVVSQALHPCSHPLELKYCMIVLWYAMFQL